MQTHKDGMHVEQVYEKPQNIIALNCFAVALSVVLHAVVAAALIWRGCGVTVALAKV